jgi:hypothetical protein
MIGTRMPRTKSGRIQQPLNDWHFMARGRAYLLSAMLIAINLLGGLFLWKIIECSGDRLKFSIILAAFVTVLVGTPHITFLCLGWFTRYREFQNSLKDKALSAYLQRYWSQRLIQGLVDQHALTDPVEAGEAPDSKWRTASDERPALCDRLFARIYHEQYGLSPFVPPLFILITVAYAAASLIGCNYHLTACDITGLTTCVYGITQQVLIGSFGGALMFVVSDSVLSIRRKSLNVSDVYWYSLRIVIAIPVALAVNSMSGTDGAHAATVFALGTFPVDALLKIIRRFGFPQLTDADKEDSSPDRLLSLNGITLPIVAVFEAEGVNSVEQVAAADPVLLSIRTGFPFRFTLRLGSQAIVRRHFGENASLLLPIGLADVVPIYLLMKAADGATSDNLPKIDKPDDVIKDAANRLFPNDTPEQREAVVRMKFRQIAAEEYTVMLARITPLDPSL